MRYASMEMLRQANLSDTNLSIILDLISMMDKDSLVTVDKSFYQDFEVKIPEFNEAIKIFIEKEIIVEVTEKVPQDKIYRISSKYSWAGENLSTWVDNIFSS